MSTFHGKTQSIHKHAEPMKMYSIVFHVIRLEHRSNGTIHAIQVNASVVHRTIALRSINKFDWIYLGFSVSTKTWLPVADNYTANNVKLQQSKHTSHLKVFKKLLLLRKNPTFADGELNLKALDDDLLVYTRELKSNSKADIFVVVLNLGLEVKPIELQKVFPTLPEKLEVVVTSINSKLLVTG